MSLSRATHGIDIRGIWWWYKESVIGNTFLTDSDEDRRSQEQGDSTAETRTMQEAGWSEVVDSLLGCTAGIRSMSD